MWLVLDTELGHIGELGSARRTVSRALDGRGAQPGHDIAVGLVLSELVSNAFRHGRPPVSVTVAIRDDATVVSVSDTGPGRPRSRRPRHDVPGGYGLRLVVEAATSWGVTQHRGPGKDVWAIVARDFTFGARMT